MPHRIVFLLAAAATVARGAPSSPPAPERDAISSVAARGDSLLSDSLRADGIVREVVLRKSGDVRRCYEVEGLRRDPGLAGTLEIELTILPTGRVDSVAVAADELRGARGTAEVAQCVAAIARNWRFDRGPYAVETVAFPFRLVPQATSIARPLAGT